MGYFDKKENGFQPESFVIDAIVGGVKVSVQHIKSAEDAKSKADAMFDGKVCTFLIVKQHFMYDALDGKQRGDWLTQYELGSWTSWYDADRREKYETHKRELETSQKKEDSEGYV